MIIIAHIVIASIFSVRGYRKKSLSLSGAISAFFVGFLTLFSGAFFGVSLIAFYLLGSLVTRVGHSFKRSVDGEYKVGGQRDAWQVFCNGGLPCLLALWYRSGPSVEHYLLIDQGSIMNAFVGAIACCVGDTFASELGILSISDPFLITTLRRVPRGTNGGVSFLGYMASVLGGFTIGLIQCLYMWMAGHSHKYCLYLIVLSVYAAFIGTTIDSIFGALFQLSVFNQKSGKITNSLSKPANKEEKIIAGIDLLSNNQVSVHFSYIEILVLCNFYVAAVANDLDSIIDEDKFGTDSAFALFNDEVDIDRSKPLCSAGLRTYLNKDIQTAKVMYAKCQKLPVLSKCHDEFFTFLISKKLQIRDGEDCIYIEKRKNHQ